MINSPHRAVPCSAALRDLTRPRPRSQISPRRWLQQLPQYYVWHSGVLWWTVKVCGKTSQSGRFREGRGAVHDSYDSAVLAAPDILDSVGTSGRRTG